MVNNLQKPKRSKKEPVLEEETKGRKSKTRSEELMEEADSGSCFRWLQKIFLRHPHWWNGLSVTVLLPCYTSSGTRLYQMLP